MKILLLSGIFALLVTSAATADNLYDKCIKRSEGTNTSWGQCASEWLKREDDNLNIIWKKVYGQTEGMTKSDLLSEQRLWNVFKESSCKFFANGDWGREGQVLHFSNCRAGVITARTKVLQEYNDFITGQ